MITLGRERTIRHLVLFALAVLGTAVAIPWSQATGENRVMGGPPDVIVSLTLGTAYVSVLFLTATLLIGPYSVIRGKQPPVQSYLRRDIGIWGAITAIAHSVLSLLINFGPLSAWDMFFYRNSDGSFGALRFDFFGIMNLTGLAATLIFVMLLALSSDRAFSSLKAKRWKSLQRWAYPAILLTLFHGISYQLISQRSTGFVILIILIIAAMVIGQVWGIAKRRMRTARP